MSRRQRLHVPGGVYYVVQRGSFHQPVFARPDDYSLFERLLAAALRRTDSRVHAYCWTPAAIHLALEISEISVGRFMQGLTSRYARAMQKRAGESGHFFRQRYRALLLDPAEYLVPLVRYLHYSPVLAGLAHRPDGFVHSSHAAYERSCVIPWLTTRTALRLLREQEPGCGYAGLIASAPSPDEVRLFDTDCAGDGRVLGGPAFVASLPRCSRPYRPTASLEQIIQTVTTRLAVERARVFSSSRERELTLARALIGWYATERRVATLSEVARRLRRDPSTLSVAISRYRAVRPELFQLAAMQDIGPLIPRESWETTAALTNSSRDHDRKTA